MSKTVELTVADDDFVPILALTVGVLTKRSSGHNLAIATHVESFEEGPDAVEELLGHEPKEMQTLQIFASLITAVAVTLEQLAGGKGPVSEAKVILMPYGADPRGMAS